MKEKNSDRIAPEYITVGCKVQKPWVRHWWGIPHAGHFYSPFPNLLFWSPVAHFLNLWWLMRDVPFTGPQLTGQGQDAAIQLFHIDKQRKKCHLQHLEIDVVIPTTRKPTLKSISLLSSNSQPYKMSVHVKKKTRWLSVDIGSLQQNRASAALIFLRSKILTIIDLCICKCSTPGWCIDDGQDNFVK